MQRILSLYRLGPLVKASGFYRVFGFFVIMALAGCIGQMFFSSGLSSTLHTLALLAIIVCVFGSVLGEGAHAGAFGRRSRKYGETLWAASQMALIPLSPLIFAAMAFYWGAFLDYPPLGGAIVGAAVGLGISGLQVLDLRKKLRESTSET